MRAGAQVPFVHTSGGQHCALEVQLPHAPMMHAWFPQSLHDPHVGGDEPLLEPGPPLPEPLLEPGPPLPEPPLELEPPPGGGQLAPTVSTPRSW
jgi:hypothetical protein